jgi:hypothetical protein
VIWFSVVAVQGVDVLFVDLGVPMREQSGNESHDQDEENTKSDADCDDKFRVHLSSIAGYVP